MEEMEVATKKTVTDLCFKHKRFNEVDISEFAQQHGWQAALSVMEECLAENVKREKRKLQVQSEGSMFKQLARKYKGRQQDGQKQQEWAEHMDNVKEAGFDASNEQLREKLQDALDAGYISHAQYETGMDFLDSIDRMKVGDKDETDESPVDKPEEI